MPLCMGFPTLHRAHRGFVGILAFRSSAWLRFEKNSCQQDGAWREGVEVWCQPSDIENNSASAPASDIQLSGLHWYFDECQGAGSLSQGVRFPIIERSNLERSWGSPTRSELCWARRSLELRYRIATAARVEKLSSRQDQGARSE